MEANRDTYIRRLETELESRGLADVLQSIRKEVAAIVSDAGPINSANSDDSFIYQQNLVQHPLLIEDIIQLVTGYLDYKTVLSVREVHSAWNNAIVTHQYLQNSQLLITFDSDLGKKLDDFLNAFPIHKFDSVQHQLPKTASLTYFGNLTTPQKLMEWFKMYGKCLNRMELNLDDYEDNVSASKSEIFVQLLSGSLPNLEELCIKQFDFMQPLEAPALQNLKSFEIGNGEPLPSNVDPENLKTILRSMSNLQILKFRLQPRGNQVDGQLVDYLRTCLDAGNLINLLELHFRKGPLNNPALELLSDVKFTKLKSLVVDFINAESADAYAFLFLRLSNLFQNVQNTLENLEIKSPTILTLFPDEMKTLKLLKCCRLDPFNSYRGYSIAFLEKLPKLESLILWADHTTPIMADQNQALICEKLFLPDLHFQHNSLKTLKLSNIDLSFVTFQRLVKMLPNIEILEVVSFNMAFIGEPFSGNINLIWNIRQFFCELMALTKLTDLRFTVLCENVKLTEQPLNDGICFYFSRLLALTRCSIICESGSAELLDRAVVNGFLKARSLKQLHLQNFVIGPAVMPLINILKEIKVRVKLSRCFNPI